MSGQSRGLKTLAGVVLIGGIALSPGSASAQSALDTCLEASGAAAIAACNEAIKASPRDAELYHARGSEFGRKRENDRAIADYNEAIRLNPEYAMAYFNRGLVLEHKSQLEQALSDFKRSAELDPSDEDAQKAVARLTAALKTARSVPAASAQVPAASSQVPAANTQTRVTTAPIPAVSTSRPAPSTPSRLGGSTAAQPTVAAQSVVETCLEASGAAAIAACNEAIKTNSRDAELYQARGSEFGRKGENDRAIADYNEAIKLNPEYAMAYFNRGLVRENKGQLQQALSDFKRSIELDPSDENTQKAVIRVTALLKIPGPAPASAESRPASTETRTATTGSRSAGTGEGWSTNITKWLSDLRNSRGLTTNSNANTAGAERAKASAVPQNAARQDPTLVQSLDHWDDQMARANGGSTANRRLNALERLGDLRSSGILTNQEYEREKRRVMDE